MIFGKFYAIIETVDKEELVKMAKELGKIEFTEGEGSKCFISIETK